VSLDHGPEAQATFFRAWRTAARTRWSWRQNVRPVGYRHRQHTDSEIDVASTAEPYISPMTTAPVSSELSQDTISLRSLIASAATQGESHQKSRAYRCRLRPLGIGACPTHNSSMYKLLHYERADYSVVVKNRAPPPKAWRWEIYRAGNAHPIKQSSIYFDTIVSAKRAGKVALTELLNKLFA
jgi:hypothetical protein